MTPTPTPTGPDAHRNACGLAAAPSPSSIAAARPLRELISSFAKTSRRCHSTFAG
jgi:hypothetical protein